LVVDPPAVHAALTDRFIDLGLRHGRLDAKEGEPVFPLATLHTSSEDAAAALDTNTHARFVGFFTPEDRLRPRFLARTTSMAELRKELERAASSGESHALAPLCAKVAAWRNDGAAVVIAAHTAG
ncbi:MAG TPA: hypothetical protein PK095_08590, partial [Myxococcota bacterium]|nr:hypothetical protein [Myxococcota bacterium]